MTTGPANKCQCTRLDEPQTASGRAANQLPSSARVRHNPANPPTLHGSACEQPVNKNKHLYNSDFHLTFLEAFVQGLWPPVEHLGFSRIECLIRMLFCLQLSQVLCTSLQMQVTLTHQNNEYAGCVGQRLTAFRVKVALHKLGQAGTTLRQ